MEKDDEPIPSMDMLGYMIEANKNNGRIERPLPDLLENVVCDILTVCLVWDNMVKQISALFMLLNECPEVQEKMFAELRETPNETLKDLNSLVYTEKCILESLRMAPALLRGTRDFKLVFQYCQFKVLIF